MIRDALICQILNTSDCAESEFTMPPCLRCTTATGWDVVSTVLFQRPLCNILQSLSTSHSKSPYEYENSNGNSHKQKSGLDRQSV